MTKGTLPPQAYTREMLTQAYQWMQTQPESIRKLADSSDALVGLYLRAKRGGDSSLETIAPVSTEDFRASLKTIAAELQQFGGNTETQRVANGRSIDFTNIDSPKFEGEIEVRNSNSNTSATSTRPNPKYSLDALDNRSRSAIQKAQQKLNLSSESEALRALIALGFERLDKL